MIKEQLADDLEYIAGSTCVNGVPVENDIICDDGLKINDKSVTITFKARVTAQAIGNIQNKCCIFEKDTTRCMASSTVIVDSSKVPVDGDDENGNNFDDDDIAPDMAEGSKVPVDDDKTNGGTPVATKVIESEVELDPPPNQIKNKKKLFIFAVVAIVVIAVIVALIFIIMALSGGNATSDDVSDSLSSYDKNTSDSSSPTYESSTSEGTSVSTNIPNLEIKTPEGLIREINGDGRTSYTMYQAKRGILGNKIVFNSISNSESIGGDERNFIAACENTANPSAVTNKWSTSDVAVEDGKEYVIRLYVHNNNPGGLDAVATNTKVAFGIPGTSGKQVQVDGFISSDNAEPNIYWGHINFIANQDFHLEYVCGSALLENDGIGKNDGIKLGDNIISRKTNRGVLIGYDNLDGFVPGGYKYHNYVTICVKAVFDTDYRIDNEVRIIGGERKWTNYVVANIGDIVEFRISYQNLHKTENQDQVKIKHILPKSLRYVDGTTKLINSAYPDGTYHFAEGSIVGNGVDIGAYKPNANAYVYFRAEVVEDGLACGKNTLVDWGQGGVGTKTIQDYASVIVDKP